MMKGTNQIFLLFVFIIALTAFVHGDNEIEGTIEHLEDCKHGHGNKLYSDSRNIKKYQCAVCGLGYYGEGGRTLCLKCPSGTTTDEVGITDSRKCKKVVIEEKSTTTRWGPGDYKDCRPGSGNVQDGNKMKSLCIACTPGKYSEGGKVECMKCPETRDQINVKLTNAHGARSIDECTCNHGYGLYETLLHYYPDNYTTPILRSANTRKYIQEMKKQANSGADKELKRVLQKCVKCPFGTYSKHSKRALKNYNNTCFSCPQDRPMTEKDGQSSITSCKRTGEKAEGCPAGYGVRYIKEDMLKDSRDQCEYPITDFAFCNKIAKQLYRNTLYPNTGRIAQVTLDDEEVDPDRPNLKRQRTNCYVNKNELRYTRGRNAGEIIKNPWNVQFNSRPLTNGENPHFGEDYSQICKTTRCRKCPENTVSEGPDGEFKPCKKCPSGFKPNEKQDGCIDNRLEDIVKRLDQQKEKQNDLSIRNSRLWQKEEIRLQHDKIMQKRKEKDNEKEKNDCKVERETGTVIFPAMAISQEIEKVEDTTCLDMNRDELLKSFCSLTSDLDELFGSQGIEKKANSFFPNICCKERRDTTLDVCEDPSGKIKRRDIIPFALSQGGDYSRHNLYAEVSDALKITGYLHIGMKKMLQSLGKDKNDNGKMVDSFFDDISLCGPRIINGPGKSESHLCQLFIPYQHAMKEFYKLVHSMYNTRELRAQAGTGQDASFLQIMERSFRKRQHRLGKNNAVKNIGTVIKAKAASPKPKVTDEKCSGGSKWTKKKLKEKKGTFCNGYKHLDLSTPQINNFAIQYAQRDIAKKCAENDKCMETLTTSLRIEVIDTACPAPLFTANDISLQKINMDGLGKVKKEWAAVVKLNTKSENGYLKSELPYCKVRDYLIGTKVKVKAYVDVDLCCDGLVDYKDCKKKESCQNGENLATLNDVNGKHFSMDVKLTGTWYEVKDSHNTESGRRRRLLQVGSASGC